MQETNENNSMPILKIVNIEKTNIVSINHVWMDTLLLV